MSDNPLLRNLVPHNARRRDFIPTEGSRITISLPGEMLTAIVERVSSEDAVVVRIDSIPMGKGHMYRKGDILPCRRIVDDLLKQEQWEVIPDRVLDAAAAEARLLEVAERRSEPESSAVSTDPSGGTRNSTTK
jgi:hypothetical protein